MGLVDHREVHDGRFGQRGQRRPELRRLQPFGRVEHEEELVALHAVEEVFPTAPVQVAGDADRQVDAVLAEAVELVVDQGVYWVDDQRYAGLQQP